MSFRELLEVNHIKTIYNIFVALLIVFIINTVVYDYIDSGRWACQSYGLALIKQMNVERMETTE